MQASLKRLHNLFNVLLPSIHTNPIGQRKLCSHIGQDLKRSLPIQMAAWQQLVYASECALWPRLRLLLVRMTAMAHAAGIPMDTNTMPPIFETAACVCNELSCLTPSHASET